MSTRAGPDEAPIIRSEIRNAATIVLYRDRAGSTEILMGQRGERAAFMPRKMVFPGGAVDDSDFSVPLAALADPVCMSRLAEECPSGVAHALLAAAIRELWEEAGLRLSHPGRWDNPPEDWISFAAPNQVPCASGLRFIFRAITPPGRPRRFDARFFMAPATLIQGDCDDFTAASDELSNIRWVSLSETHTLDLPFITEIVLAEVRRRFETGRDPDTIPFFRNGAEDSLFHALGRG